MHHILSTDTLQRTMGHLIDDVLKNNKLEQCHAFIRDRMRAIRQNFTRQHITGIKAINAFEKMARFHTMCLHNMCQYDQGKFSSQQELEQLKKILLSLMEFYSDLRMEGVETENEAEFRAYNIITHLHNQDVIFQTMCLPLPLFKDPQIQLALKFHALASRNNEIMESSSRKNKPLNIPAAQNFYTEFFNLAAKPETWFLLGCLLESNFAEVRKGALKSMNLCYVHKLSGMPATHIKKVLCYDSLT